jgi:hypothetical protein
MKINKAQAQPVLSKTFPDYKGRKFSVEFVNSVTFYDTNWSGGTRNKYAFLASSGETATFNAPAPWSNPVEGKTVELPENVIIAEHTIFCGKDLGITFYMHPANAPKWLSDGQAA